MARKKLEESDKKSRTSIYINKLLNNRVDDFLKETGEKKSQLIEKLLKEYIEGKDVK